MLSSLSTEDLIPAEHPIRRIRVVVDAVLAEMDVTFEKMYSTSSEDEMAMSVCVDGGRPCVRRLAR
jgi:hypothetical protein